MAVPLIAGLGDRIPRRSVLLTSLLVATASVVGVLAVLLLWPSLVLLAILAASFATAAGVAWALVGALLPMLAGTPEELVAANATSTTMEGAGGLVGPLVAAVLLGAGGTAAVAIAAAGTMAIAAGMAVGIPAEAPGAISTAPGGG